MAKMTGSQAVVESLKAEGVGVVFGLPGVHAMPLYDALYEHPEVRYIGVRHEQAAAYMADGYARATGRVGVCLTTTGPGAANTAAAMAEAYASSSPVLQITTQIESRLLERGKGALHEARDQQGMFEAVTGRTRRLERVEDIPGAIRWAFRKIRTERPRPIVLEIPTDLLTQTADIELLPPEQYERPGGYPARVEEAARWLAGARRPTLWAGGGVIASGASPELLRLAEVLQAPVLTTYLGKGAIPEDHPLSVANWANAADTRDLLQEFLESSDVMLAVGSRFSAMSTANWSLALPEKLIQVDLDAEEIGKNYPAPLGIVGDARAVLAQLLRHLEGLNAAPRPSPAPEIESLRSVVHEIVQATQAGYLQVLETVRSVLDRDAIVANDMTMLCYAASRHFRVYEPRTFLYPMGFGTLGFGFPAALGAKLACPQRQVVCLCGDGGFLIGCQELATAVQYGINLPVLLFNDGGYGVLRETQDIEYSGRRLGVDLHNPNFVKLAEAFGARGVRVEAIDEIGPALDEALKSPGPTLIEVVAALGS